MMKFLKIFRKKKKRRNKTIFQKYKNAEATYKKRKNVSIKIDTKFLRKLSYLYYAIGALFVGSLIYLFMFSQYFLVKNIKVERQDNYSNIEIAYNILNEYLKNNIFMLDVSDIRKELSNSQENLGKILISKQFPQTLKVNLTSFTAVYNTMIKEKEHLILANGSAVPGKKDDVPFLELKFTELPVFYEYKKILSESELRTIYEIDTLLKLNFISVPYEKINYYIAEKEGHIILESGATLIFDLLGNPQSQIEKLSVFHQENLEIVDNSLIYVDLRIDGKLYFCTTEQEFNCYNNLNFIYGKER